MIVYCPCAECKYNGKNNKCKAKSITLSAHYVTTLWEGRQDFWKCKAFEMTEEAAEIINQVNATFGDQEGGMTFSGVLREDLIRAGLLVPCAECVYAVYDEGKEDETWCDLRHDFKSNRHACPMGDRRKKG